jgi:hypothetical protein
MQNAITKIICALALLIVLTGCKDLATYTFSPYPDVNLTVTAQKVSYHEFEDVGKTTFVHFKYTIIADSSQPVYFNIENISASINGLVNTGTYYDTVASILPQWQRLNNGVSTIEAYAVFPGTIDASEIHNLQFINYGLLRKGNGGIKQ